MLRLGANVSVQVVGHERECFDCLNECARPTGSGLFIATRELSFRVVCIRLKELEELLELTRSFSDMRFLRFLIPLELT